MKVSPQAVKRAAILSAATFGILSLCLLLAEKSGSWPHRHHHHHHHHTDSDSHFPQEALGAFLKDRGLRTRRGLKEGDPFTVDKNTALVLTDPQNDFLSPDGVTWGVVGDSVTENDTVMHIKQLIEAAKDGGMEVYISPHYYYPWDHKWKFGGFLETLMHSIGMFDRVGPLSLKGFKNSGADWLDEYKDYINDGETIIASPHKVYGNQPNDLSLQLRKRKRNKVILAGMSANLCVESHLRHLLEEGFEVAVVSDATAAAKLDIGDGYEAAMTNFKFIASAVWTTAETVKEIEKVFR